MGTVRRLDGGRASIDPPNETKGIDIVRLLLEHGANPNMQLFFRPANVRGSTNTRGSTPLIRAANDGDIELVKLLLEHGADATLYMADRQTPIHAVLAGRAPEKARARAHQGASRRGHGRERRRARSTTRKRFGAASALHFAVRKRYKDVIKLLASYGIDMNLKDQDGLTALDYTQSRGFMPFMANQTPALQRRSGAAARARRHRDADRKIPCGRCSARRKASGRTSGRSVSRSFMSRSTSTQPVQ